MTKARFPSDRFTQESGFHITVQVPDTHVKIVLDGILEAAPLTQGDYDNVAFKTASGIQQFRSLGTGRNPQSPGVVDVPCLELSFFLPEDTALVASVLEAIYHTHPYEEPVIRVQDALRTRHIPGRDEDNPNRIWMSPEADWYRP